MSITYQPSPNLSSRRGSGRSARRILTSAYDRYEAETAEWAAGGWVGDPPEFHGDDRAARIVLADGTEIIFLFDPPEPCGAPKPAIANNDNADTDHDWRVKAGCAAGPPPPADDHDGDVA